MRIARFEALGKVQYGMIENDVLRGFQGSPFENFSGPGCSFPLDGSAYNLSEVKLLTPCSPSKYVGITLNFRKTAEHFKVALPKVPIMFLKPTTSVIGPNDNIILPPGSLKVMHEGELALVIGKRGKDVSEERAREYLLGLTCTNDVSDHSNLEEDHWNLTRAKVRDTFGPLGPWIETEVDPDDLRIEVYVNGGLRQRGSTSDLVFGINKIISFVSSVMTLLPGDVIATGTPPVSDIMKTGDVVEVNVDKIGTLKNFVVGSD